MVYSHVQQKEDNNDKKAESPPPHHVEVVAALQSTPSTLADHIADHDHDHDDDSSYSPVTFILSPVILCILIAEVGERFCFFGFRAVLTLYFVHELNYTEHGAVAYFAYTTSLAYLSPVLGALLADGQWGRYHTILIFGFIYLVGMIVLTNAAWTTTTTPSSSEEESAAAADAADTETTTIVDHVGMRRFLTFVGLFLVCTGTGGIKPCVSAFGADQISLRSSKKKKDINNSDDKNEYSIMNDAFVVHEQDGIMRNNNSSPQKEEQKDQYHHHEESDTRVQSSTAGINGIIQPSSPTSQPSQPSPTNNKEEFDDEESYDASSHASSSLTGTGGPSERRQVREFFGYFYVCINVGALLSIAIIPIVRSRYGYGPAFGLSALFFFISMLIFLSKRHAYVHHVPGQDGSSLSTTFALCYWLVIYNLYHHQVWFRRIFPFCRPGRFPRTKPKTATRVATTAQPTSSRGVRRHQLRQGNGSMMIPITRETVDHSPDDHQSVSSSSTSSGEEEMDDITRQQLSDAAQALHVLPILAMLPLFWSLYDQQGSIWTLQATRMKLFGLSAEQLCTVNPLEIMIFVPLFSRVIYPALQSRGISIAPLRRMRWGFFLTAVSFSISGLLESKIDNSEEGTINVFWQLPQLTILAVAEIFVSVTGLEFAYTKSPDRLKAFIMAIFFLTTAAGNLISGVLYSSVFTYLSRALIMHVCALLMLANLALFYYVSTWWQHREAQQLLPRGMGLSSQSQRQKHEGIELATATRVV